MPRLPVTVLSSIDAVLRDSTTFAVLAESPDSVVVRHDLSQAGATGTMRRTVTDSSGVVEDVALPLEHACLSCALREDVLPTLVRLADEGRWSAAVLALPVGGEPLAVARGLVGGDVAGRPVARRLRLAGVLAVLDAASLDEDLFGDDLLAERDLAHSDDDRRSVGEVLAHQVELADLVLVDGLTGGAADASVLSLLSHLVPAPAVVRPGPHEVPARELLGVRCDPEVMWSRADPLQVRPTGAPDGHGVWTLDLHSWKPLHPQRLHDEIEALGSGAVRARGHFWLPGRPDTVAGWDGAGGQLSIGEVRGWGRRDRSTRIVVTGVDDADRRRVRDAFGRALTTDAEVARGRRWWVSQEDGFDPWLGERTSAV